MSAGFITLHRSAFANPVLRDGERFRAWCYLIAHAAFRPTRQDARGRTIVLDRGQICAGRDQLAREWRWSPSAVERFLVRLETEHMIERQSGQGKTIITICNYSKYQDLADPTGQITGQHFEQKSDRSRTTKEQRNKETTKVGEGKIELLPLVPDDPEDDDLIGETEVIDGWNSLAERHGLPRIAKLTDRRRRKLRLQRKRWIVAEWVSVWAKIEQSPFLKGVNERGWRCDFDFVLSETNFTKILEGKYDPQPTDGRHLRLAR